VAPGAAVFAPLLPVFAPVFSALTTVLSPLLARLSAVFVTLLAPLLASGPAALGVPTLAALLGSRLGPGLGKDEHQAQNH
jgi:hypothetical protein